MHQILIIFRKDCRRFWPEICFSLAVLVAFVFVYPYTWLPHEEIPYSLLGISIAHDSFGSLPILFIGLIPVTWIVLITRVVQDEALVGDRQYWVTRPIGWPRLIAAKLLFVALFQEFPYALSLALVLHRAGFAIFPDLPRLILLLAFTFLLFVLPIFALATLTRNFFRLFLTIVGFLVALIALAMVTDGFESHSPFLPYTDFISASLFIVTCIIIILVQYSSRTVWLGRGLAFVSISLTILIAANPLQSVMLEHLYYPAVAPHTLPVDISIPKDDPSRTISLSGADERHPSLTIPLTIANVPFGYQISPEDARLSIEDSNGSTYQGAWQPVSGRIYLVSTQYGTIQLQLDQTLLTRLRAHPVTLRLTLALAQWEDGVSTRIPVPATQQVAVPGLGICAIDQNSSRRPGLLCRYTFRKAPSFRITAPWTTQPCLNSTSSERATAELSAYPGTSIPTPIDVSLTSVWVEAVSFALRGSVDQELNDLPPVTLCSGTSLTVTPLRLVRRARVEITYPDFKYLSPDKPSGVLSDLAPASKP